MYNVLLIIPWGTLVPNIVFQIPQHNSKILCSFRILTFSQTSWQRHCLEEIDLVEKFLKGSYNSMSAVWAGTRRGSWGMCIANLSALLYTGVNLCEQVFFQNLEIIKLMHFEKALNTEWSYALGGTGLNIILLSTWKLWLNMK